ncbi:MAG: C4-dicarboxylate ABC transporter permease, partial [Gammaproteobacteria bacterium]|nr:C4-dicarboxylate ABC transporter permease [Gammaproteobacteria bacterium]
MGSEAIGAIGLGCLLILMILRVPVALTMLIVGVVGFAQVVSWDAAIAQLKTVP